VTLETNCQLTIQYAGRGQQRPDLPIMTRINSTADIHIDHSRKQINRHIFIVFGHPRDYIGLCRRPASTTPTIARHYRSVVRQSVCTSVTLVHPAKSVGRNETPFDKYAPEIPNYQCVGKLL